MNTIMSRTVRMTASAVAGVIAAVALTGCGLSAGEDGRDHVKTVGYVSGVEGKNDEEARLPGWVPDEAKSVTEIIRTTGTERILRYELSGGGLPTTCASGAASTTAATLTADWWPRDKESKTDQVCDKDWYVLVEDDAVYAFKPETLDQSNTN